MLLKTLKDNQEVNSSIKAAEYASYVLDLIYQGQPPKTDEEMKAYNLPLNDKFLALFNNEEARSRFEVKMKDNIYDRVFCITPTRFFVKPGSFNESCLF